MHLILAKSGGDERGIMKKWFLVLTIVLLVLSPSCFWSLDVEAASGTVHITAYSISDSDTNSLSPDTNYGDSGALYVNANSELDYAYIKFDLSSLPSDANVISASLDVFLWGTGGNIYVGDTIGAYYCSSNSWTEFEITWNNKPSFNPSATDTWSFSSSYTIEVYKSWNVAADVRTALPSGLLTEVLKFSSKTGNGYAQFQTRESANVPKLEIEYTLASILSSFSSQFATNNAMVIYPSDTPTKPLGCGAAWVSDWLASAFVTTKLQYYTEGLDLNASFVNQTSGRAVGNSGIGVLSMGGPIVNPAVKYAEIDTTPSADRAPIRFHDEGGSFYFQYSNGTDIAGASLPISVVNHDQDMFVIEVYMDASERYVMFCYGFGWKGTYAAGKYFDTTIHPNLASYNISWIVVKWQDTSGDNFVNNPSNGDTYTVIASGI